MANYLLLNNSHPLHQDNADGFVNAITGELILQQLGI